MDTKHPKDEETGYGSVSGQKSGHATEDSYLRNMAIAAANASEEEGFLNRRATTLLTEDRRGTKHSIFSDSLVEQIEDATAKKKIGEATKGVLLQALAFFCMVAFSGLTPFLQRSLMTSSKTGSKNTNFIPSTLYLMNYAISVIVGNIISFACKGRQGVKSCWEPISIMKFFPALFLSSISETMQTFVLMYLDGTSWRIVKQTKLPLTAVGVYVLLGSRRTSGVQWMLIVSISLLVFAYCAINYQHQQAGSFEMRGVLIAMFSIGCTVIAGILGDVTYKSVKHPLYIQIPQGRLTSFTVILCFTVGYTWYHNLWHKFLLKGWTIGVFLMTCWLSLKDWIAAFVLKHLDSIWKALGGVLSLVVAYIIDLSQGSRTLKPVPFSIITCVMLNVFAFALSKREGHGTPQKAK